MNTTIKALICVLSIGLCAQSNANFMDTISEFGSTALKVASENKESLALAAATGVALWAGKKVYDYATTPTLKFSILKNKKGFTICHQPLENDNNVIIRIIKENKSYSIAVSTTFANNVITNGRRDTKHNNLSLSELKIMINVALQNISNKSHKDTLEKAILIEIDKLNNVVSYNILGKEIPTHQRQMVYARQNTKGETLPTKQRIPFGSKKENLHLLLQNLFLKIYKIKFIR